MTTIRIMQPWGDPREEYLEDDEFSVHAEIEEATRCQHCADPIAEYPGIGWVHDGTGERWCGNLTDEEAAEDDEATAAAPGTSLPGNWIGLSTDPEKESVSVQISLGDPRGCLEMTVRRWENPETGQRGLLLSLPHPDDSTPHVDLTEWHPGTYFIGGAS